jgi:hypothetical protein
MSQNLRMLVGGLIAAGAAPYIITTGAAHSKSGLYTNHRLTIMQKEYKNDATTVAQLEHPHLSAV